MKYIALNGFGHRLNRYFNDSVECPFQVNWTERNAIDLARSLTEPTTIIGFSDGATAALTVANHSPHVVRCHAHSPMFRKERRYRPCRISLYISSGDKTPTWDATYRVYNHYLKNVPDHNITYEILPIKYHQPIRDVATLVMRWKNHQFHNCLSRFPPEIVNPSYLRYHNKKVYNHDN